MTSLINQRRLSDIGFKIDKNLNIKDGNRSFLILLHKTDLKALNLSILLSDTDFKNLKFAVKNFSESEEDTALSFIARIKPKDNFLSCIFTITKDDDGLFNVILEELSYSRELLDKALLESREYSALLQNFDASYFMYDGERFIVKNTKDLTTLYSGEQAGFVELFEKYFKVNFEQKECQAHFDSMMANLSKMEANKYYNFPLQDRKMITIHTLKTSTRKNSIIVGSINFGKKTDPEANLYAESRDGLTGLYNKKAITEMAIKKINEERKPCTLIIIDVDKFKECNDTFGHVFGDRVLVAVSSCIKDAVNGHGIAGRIGGDEFVILLDRTDEEDIRNVTRNIRTAIQWNITAVEPGSMVTCSMGIARYPENASSYEELFKLADKCLYIAKYRGRNCYIIYKPEIHDKIIAENVQSEDKVASGKFFNDAATAQLAIINVLQEKKGDFVKDALDILLEYMQVSKITVYDSHLEPAYILGKDSVDYRSEYLGSRDYFKYFNDYDFIHLDNTNVLDSVDTKRYRIYQQGNISSIIEVLSRDKKGKKKCLICYDIYKPARTFPKDKITFAIVAAKMISNYI